MKDILGEEPVPVQYDKAPWAIYCQPEVAFAGLRGGGRGGRATRSSPRSTSYRGNSRAQIVGETEGLVKIIAEKDGPAGRSSACTWSARGSPSSSGQGYLAVNWEATVDEVADFIQPHPTLSSSCSVETVLAMTGRGPHG